LYGVPNANGADRHFEGTHMKMSSISVDSLPMASANELFSKLSTAGEKVEREVSGTDRTYGDANLLNIVFTVAPSAISTMLIVLFGPAGLAKSHRSSYKFRKVEPDGTTTEFKLKITDKERQRKQLNTSTLKQLVKLTGMSIDEIQSAITQDIV
jgi:hypothetical protein